LGIIAQIPDADVAVAAKQTAHESGCVVVVYRQREIEITNATLALLRDPQFVELSIR